MRKKILLLLLLITSLVLFSCEDSIKLKEKFTISFDTKGGSPIPSQEIEINKQATQPEPPFKQGFQLLYWYTSEEENSEAYDFTQPITEDLTLYASWGKYHIRFNYNGGEEGYNSLPQTYGSNYVLETTTKEGFSFQGWFDSDGNEYKETDICNLDKNVDVYAKWEDKSNLEIKTNSINNAKSAILKIGNTSFNKQDLPFTQEVNLGKENVTIEIYDNSDKLIYTFVYLNYDFTKYKPYVFNLEVKLPSESSYVLGPAGGYIFYDVDSDNTTSDTDGEDNLNSNSCGYRYLEAAPQLLRLIGDTPTIDKDQVGFDTAEDKFPFGYYKDSDGNLLMADGSQNVHTENATRAEIGKGLFNTNLLFGKMNDKAYLGENTTTDKYAARLASLLEYNGYDDWFIPAINTLEPLYNNLAQKAYIFDSLITNNSKTILSSTEYYTTDYWANTFDDNQGEISCYRTQPWYVWCIRQTN